MRVFLLMLALLLAGCAAGPAGPATGAVGREDPQPADPDCQYQGALPAPASPDGLLADAGRELDVLPGEKIVLDGTDSRGDGNLTYHWQQVGGVCVTLSATEGPYPWLVVPQIDTERASIDLVLAVSTGAKVSHPDGVTLTIWRDALPEPALR